MAPLEELKLLAQEIEGARTLDALKPVFERLDELARVYVHDFEIQLVVADLREKLVHRGVSLRRMEPEPAAPPAEILEEPGKKPLNIRRTLAIGAGLGVVGWLVLFVTLVQVARNRNIDPKPAAPATAATTPAVAGTVPVDVITTPPGATIQVNNDTKCTSNCRLNLAPGNYQVTAMLDGYDPAATGVTVIPGAPINVTLALLNQAQTVRIFTDLASGRAVLDGGLPQELTDGQLVFDRVKNGRHKLQVYGPTHDATFTFNLVAGKAPALEGGIVANNLIAVLVGSFGANAHVESNSGPVKVSLNGKPMGETGPGAGLDIKNVPTGDQQLTIGEGPEQRKMVVTFGSMPALTAFLKSDVNIGTLIVSTGEDDVTVYLNGREYRRTTRRGQLRIPFLGNVRVGVAKEGFQPPADQTAEVKKGEESRLAFTLKPLPQVASLQIRGGQPGTSVSIDEHAIGRVGADGTLSAANLSPGERTIELRREGYVNKKITRTLKAGETLTLSGADLAMSIAVGTLHLVLTPADAVVTYRRADEAPRTARDATLRLEPGNYTFTAKAPGFLERTERIPVVAGETRNVELSLAKEKVEAPKPKTPIVAPTGSNDWTGWTTEGGAHVRKGGNRVRVHAGPLNGTITFSAQLRKGGGLFRGQKLRWFIDDGTQVTQFEVDKKQFRSKAESDAGDRDEGEEKQFTVQIEISPDRFTQRARYNGKWVTLVSAPGRSIPNGQFGFVLPGNDEIAVTDFRFSPH